MVLKDQSIPPQSQSDMEVEAYRYHFDIKVASLVYDSRYPSTMMVY